MDEPEEIPFDSETLENIRKTAKKEGIPLDDIFSMISETVKKLYEICKAPAEKYRVVCMDRIDVQGDYDSIDEALAAAEELTNELRARASDKEDIIGYSIFDDEGTMIGPDDEDESCF